MMTMGERIHRDPTVDVPPWPVFEEQLPLTGFGSATAGDSYLLSEAVMAAALQRYLSAEETAETDEGPADLVDPPVDAFSCDEFRIYEFKVRRCARARSHDWTDCPFAHPGEKARRRDPRKFHYSGAACPDFRKGICRRGDACEYAHGVFECWLHPARYRTQPCKDGTACRRRVCFFAHTPEQLRVLPQQQQIPPRSAAAESYDGSPLRARAIDGLFGNVVCSSSSPRSALISISPPLSPTSDSPPISPVNEALASMMRKLQLSKAKSVPSSPWAMGPGSVEIGFSPGFCSLPSTPVRAPVCGGGGSPAATGFTGFDEASEPVERVESGRALRAKMYERLSRDSGLGRAEAPDVGWVSELVK